MDNPVAEHRLITVDPSLGIGPGSTLKYLCHIRYPILILLVLFVADLNAQDKYREKKTAKLKKAMDEGNDKLTLDLAELLLERYPDSEGFLFPKGVALLGMGKYSEAQTVADNLIKKNPGSLNGARLQGRIALAEGRGEDAVRYLERAEEMESKAFYRYLLGKAYNLTRQYSAAIVAFDESIRIGSGSSYSAYRERAVSHMGMGDTTLARKDFDKAIELAPKDPVNYNARGYHLWQALGEHHKAVADFSEAVRINVNYSFAFNNRAWSNYQIGEKAKASQDLKNAERRRPDNPFLHWNKARIALAEGRPTACGHALKAIELGLGNFEPEESAEFLQVNCKDVKVPEEKKEVKPEKPVKKPFRSNAPGG